MRAVADGCVVTVFGADVEGAVRRFLKSCRESGLFTELKRREAYLPPSVRKRLKRQKAQQRRVRAARRQRADVDWKPSRDTRA
jgi:small subunit ribosomal protein S21